MLAVTRPACTRPPATRRLIDVGPGAETLTMADGVTPAPRGALPATEMLDPNGLSHLDGIVTAIGDRKAHSMSMDQAVTRRQARRMSRDFAEVGMEMSEARVREISAGAEPTDQETHDIEFALRATEGEHRQRLVRAELQNAAARKRLRLALTFLAAVVALQLALVALWLISTDANRLFTGFASS